MNRANAENRIKNIFRIYKAAQSDTVKHISTKSHGKVYELYVLSELLKELAQDGCSIKYSHPGLSLAFKSAPGLLRQNEPHFNISSNSDPQMKLQVFVNVEFQTYSAFYNNMNGQSDLSSFHEIDIGVFLDSQINNARPDCNQIYFGIECKAVTKLSKDIIRGVIGLRLEMGNALNNSLKYLIMPPSLIKKNMRLRFVTTNKKINKYILGPSWYGVYSQYIKP